MSDRQLYPFDFHGSTVHTLILGPRPAWVARELGEALGYARDGQRLVDKIQGEWAQDLLPRHDFDLVVGDELAWLRAQVPLVSRSAKGLVVLYESGLHLVLAKSHMPLARQLRRLLVSELLPQLERTRTYTPEPQSTTVVDLQAFREQRLATRVNLADRKFRSVQLRQTATALFERGQLDEQSWLHCMRMSCEIALDQPFPTLESVSQRDWVDARWLANAHSWGLARVLGAASALELLDRPEMALPVPVRDRGAWTVSFHFSPTAALQIEAWLEEHPAQLRNDPPGDAA